MNKSHSNCIICGTQFKLVKGKGNKFCGLPCYRISQRRGDYAGLRESVRKHNCSNCGKEVTGVSKSRKRNGDVAENVFCNRDCYDEHRRKIKYTVKALCLNCNTEITNDTTGSNNPKYCSWSCRTEHKKPPTYTRVCKVCHIEFCSIKYAKGKVVKEYYRTTCSEECRIQDIKTNSDRKEKISKAFTGSNHPNWLGGSSYLNFGGFRGSNWKRIRKQVIERDGFKCVHCGIEQEEHKLKYKCDFNVNHKVPFHQFGGKTEHANRLSNLETLCKSCHTKADWKYRKENQMQNIFHF